MEGGGGIEDFKLHIQASSHMPWWTSWQMARIINLAASWKLLIHQEESWSYSPDKRCSHRCPPRGQEGDLQEENSPKCAHSRVAIVNSTLPYRKTAVASICNRKRGFARTGSWRPYSHVAPTCAHTSTLRAHTQAPYVRTHKHPTCAHTSTLRAHTQTPHSSFPVLSIIERLLSATQGMAAQLWHSS